MSNTIRLYYHDGYIINKWNPFELIVNLTRFGKIHTPVYNIGDQISPVIVEGLSGKKVKHVHGFCKNKMLAIGSILAGIKPGDIAWGTGLMKPEHVKFVKGVSNINIVAVRGPETYRVLSDEGIECAEVFGDPALLMPKLFMPQSEKKYSLGIIPHISQIGYFQERKLSNDCILISPKEHWRTFISKINECKKIISSSLHGVILADAYGVPAVPIKHGEFLHGTPFKFIDYYRSTEREPYFINSEKALDDSEWLAQWERIGTPKINLDPLIKAFPYKIIEDGAI